MLNHLSKCEILKLIIKIKVLKIDGNLIFLLSTVNRYAYDKKDSPLKTGSLGIDDYSTTSLLLLESIRI